MAKLRLHYQPLESTTTGVITTFSLKAIFICRKAGKENT